MIIISLLRLQDITLLEGAFASFYAKKASIFEKYLQEQEAGERIVWVASSEIAKNEVIQKDDNLDCGVSSSQFQIA